MAGRTGDLHGAFTPAPCCRDLLPGAVLPGLEGQGGASGTDRTNGCCIARQWNPGRGAGVRRGRPWFSQPNHPDSGFRRDRTLFPPTPETIQLKSQEKMS